MAGQCSVCGCIVLDDDGSTICPSCEMEELQGVDEGDDPGDMDGDLASGLASAGFGTDEDYGMYDDRDWDDDY